MPETSASRVFRDLRYHVFTCDEAGDFCGCEAAGARDFREELRTTIAKRGLARYVKMTIFTCNQPGVHGPALVVQPDGIWYDGLTIEDIPRFIDEQLVAGRVLEDRLLRRPITVGASAYTRESHGAGAVREGPAIATDLVCEMSVVIATAKQTFDHLGQTYYFCGPACRKLFATNPAQFVPV